MQAISLQKTQRLDTLIMKTLCLLFLTILTFTSGPVRASTLQPFTFEEMAQQAGLIFQGSVTDTREVSQDGLIYTYVRFQVEDVIKGYYPGEQVELRFLGGSENGRRLVVTDSGIPREGERGIYFVESLTASLINPLLGWSQGHYLIRSTESGEEIVIPRPDSTGAELTVRKNGALAEKIQTMRFGKSAVIRSLGNDNSSVQLQEFKDRVRRQLP